jgi:hypothetical protein
MSTQPFSSLETQAPPCTDKSVCATPAQRTSLLDEPWKVVVLPEEPKLPPGLTPQPANIGPSGDPVKLWPAPEPRAAKSLPWRVGDVTRLKDDSPKGMMEYIATHSTGWWQEMAQRALRDTEKAERMAREQGWQPGQYWALEVDAEAKQKLLEAEEAKRAREEAERAKELAEKEAFAKRQMELLEKAGRAPRCEYKYTDGRGCRAPQVKGERWCHGHAKTMSYRPEHLEILPMEDEQAVMVNLYRVTKSLLSGRITEKVAGLTLWSIAIGAPGAAKHSPQRSRRAQRKSGKHLPQMNADGRRSERKISRESRHAGTGSTRKNTNHPGVTNDNSCVSGVTHGSTSGARSRESDSRKNSLKPNGHDRHSRDLSTLTPTHENRVRRGPRTPPHCPSQAQGRSESLKMTRVGGRGLPTKDTKEHKEEQLNTCFSTQLHRDTQDRAANGANIMKTGPKHV